ncbi:unnamed protein product [Pleuronectes platessa]|uniref:Copine-8 n=1 Tax=Pleuronectes platessa TaxID=8262 RepID=A0A9N7V0Q0_PLEPL|nr:unnamed protein product [Pleuronectes platessa]
MALHAGNVRWPPTHQNQACKLWIGAQTAVSLHQLLHIKNCHCWKSLLNHLFTSSIVAVPSSFKCVSPAFVPRSKIKKRRIRWFGRLLSKSSDGIPKAKSEVDSYWQKKEGQAIGNLMMAEMEEKEEMDCNVWKKVIAAKYPTGFHGDSPYPLYLPLYLHEPIHPKPQMWTWGGGTMFAQRCRNGFCHHSADPAQARIKPLDCTGGEQPEEKHCFPFFFDRMNNSFLNMASIGDFDPLNASIPATKVEITVSCRNLLDRDTFSKSDPICVLYAQGMGNKEWREFGRTEVIDNTLNPDFVRKFILDYFFEERQNLRFDLYDVDSKSANLSKHDFLGQAYCTLGEVVGSLGSRLEKPLGGIPGKKCGTIIVKAEELNNCRESVMMQFCGNKLDKKDFFGKSDPFLVFYRSNEDGTFTICHKTEVVKNTLNPVWQAFKISVRALCNGDYDRTIKVEVYDWDRDGSHDFIGEFSTSYRELSRGQSQFNVYEVVNPKKKGKKKKYLNSGTVTLLSFLVDIEVTFLDYIKGG